MNGLSREMIIHPGETLKEVLTDRSISIPDFAHEVAFDETYISDILLGKKDISENLAKRLESSLHIEATFWLNLQSAYDKELKEFEKYTTENSHNYAKKHCPSHSYVAF